MHKSGYTIGKIREITGGKFLNSTNSGEAINNILIDSRRLVNPGNLLFVALRSAKNDGHNFLGELYEKGVRNFLVSKHPEQIATKEDANIVRVDHTLDALQALGAWHRRQFNIPVVGVTGSNGKTIVKEWLFQLLNDDYVIIRSPKSYNSQIGVPLSVLQMNHEHTLAIFEAGISLPEEMGSLSKIIQPTLGIFTNIGEAHNENFISLPQKVGEKLKLFTKVDTLFYCSDHFPVREQIIKSEVFSRQVVFPWSRGPDGQLQVKRVIKNQKDTQLFASYKGEAVETKIPFTDDASIENAIHCWMFMLFLGYESLEITRRMSRLTPVAMRLELKEGINNCSVVNDSYNSDVNSLAIALDFLNQQKQHSKKTVILSDILQSGLSSYSLYQRVQELLSEKKVTRLIGIGPEISKQQARFEEMDTRFFKDTNDFLTRFSLASLNSEIILLKGARVFEFERIDQMLQQQTHTTILEIDLSALLENFNFFKSRVSPETKIMAMVKAFSYGSGSYEIANVLQYHRADYLGVAYTDEGVELRKAGITLPLMVMNPEPHSFNTMIYHDLEPEVYSFRILDLLVQAAERSVVLERNPVGIHIKLDTGMRRLGFDDKQVDDLIQRLRKAPFLKVKSVFSHLAVSDDPHQQEFTLEQIHCFQQMVQKFKDAFDHQIIFHIANSAAITRYPQARMDMVRLGIGLYGIATDNQVARHLSAVSRLITSVSQIKNVKKGESVGYGRTFKAVNDMEIATVAMGYADGLSRKLGNGKGELWLKGHKVPIVGNVCMDMCMVDITGLDVNEGDEVVVFGPEHPVENLARNLETIPYEVLTSVSARVKRVYLQDS